MPIEDHPVCVQMTIRIFCEKMQGKSSRDTVSVLTDAIEQTALNLALNFSFVQDAVFDALDKDVSLQGPIQ